MVENIVVKAKIKEVAGDSNIASNFAEALNEKVVALIQTAVARAKANDRKTVMAKDL
ncbi:MAG: DUF1931 domain-containing protein [Candidatus Woesearchaeota archaeon]